MSMNSLFYSFTAMASGYFIGKWGHISIFIKYGSFFSCIGVYLITLINIDTSYTIEFFIFMLYGLSIGVIYQNCILMAQQVSPPEYLGISTSISSFFNYIGGVIGVGIYGAFLQNIYPRCYRNHFPQASPITLNDIHDVYMGNVIYVEAIRKTYLYSVFPVNILIFLSSLLIKDYKFNTNNKTKNHKEKKVEKEMKQQKDNNQIIVSVSLDDKN
ncbi:hypothetical protein PIROE2DRAFT_6210 [Piromyces sp. E2]|nr:hypothetical protein PIROE2DRAFT_6210 [Piromyces sp. E2]|eukprot:OUM66581.1 hypothetical protein PIROE2DRAFT_6210 [Piromyces sp. E2]